jgi:hypothetical protein
MLNYLTNIKEPRRDAIKDALERQAQEEAEAEQQESNETEDNSTE